MAVKFEDVKPIAEKYGIEIIHKGKGVVGLKFTRILSDPTSVLVDIISTLLEENYALKITSMLCINGSASPQGVVLNFGWK